MSKNYLLDSQRSRFTVQAFAAGMLAGFAHSPTFAVRQFDGRFRFDPENMADPPLELTVKAASLQLTDSVKEADRVQIQMQLMDEVLEVTKYPDIIFHGTSIAATRIADAWFRAQIRGDLKLHGLVRAVAIDSQLRFVESDVRLAGDFSILLSDYRIKRVSAVGGLIKLKDELKFVFDLLGHSEC